MQSRLKLNTQNFSTGGLSRDFFYRLRLTADITLIAFNSNSTTPTPNPCEKQQKAWCFFPLVTLILLVTGWPSGFPQINVNSPSQNVLGNCVRCYDSQGKSGDASTSVTLFWPTNGYAGMATFYPTGVVCITAS